MAVINTNITAMIGQQNLNESKSALTTSMERLSSGLRINSAKDDAAGQAIANRMSSQITGLGQAQRNANDGISVAQTAEGGLNQINDNLQRVRELTVQAQNDTNSDSDLQSIQDEINQRLNEVDRITNETTFNGKTVLNGAGDINIQVGANDNETIKIELGDNGLTSENGLLDSLYKADPNNAGNRLGSFVVTKGDITTSDVAASAPAGTTDMFTTETVTFGTPSESSGGSKAFTNGDSGVYKLNDGSGYVAKADDNTFWEAAVAADGSVTIDSATPANEVSSSEVDTAGGALATGERSLTYTDLNGSESANVRAYSGDEEGAPDYVVVDSSGSEPAYYKAAIAADGEVTRGELLTTENDTTANPLETLDDALNAVDGLRSDLGAIQNRFDSAITNLSTTETNLSAARSRIEDADYATEVANMTKNQILQQAGTSVLAQANQLPQSALSLLG